MAIDIPTLTVSRVYHIGTLNPADYGRNFGSSQEGKCLSVSVCPVAWRKIAKLGGYQLHEMENENGSFVDIIKLVEEHGDELKAWGVAEGLIEQREALKAWYYDEDSEEWRYTIEADMEGAVFTADEFGEYDDPAEIPGPDDGPAIEEVTVSGPTEKLFQITGIKDDRYSEALETVAMAYAILKSDADGIWWLSEYDPEALRAPRGGIFPEKVSAWEAVPMSFSAMNDEDLMEEFEEGISISSSFGASL